MKKRTRIAQSGFTLIEILIVVALMAGLMAILMRTMTTQSENAKRDEARIAIGMIDQSMQIYRIHNGSFPTTEQGLEALVREPSGAKNWRGPYMENAKSLNDPWGNPFSYESDGAKFKITSGSSDGQVGTADDVIYPEEDKPANQ